MNEESETLKPDTKDPLWLISKDNPDRLYYLIDAESDLDDYGYTIYNVTIGALFDIDGPWRATGYASEDAIKAAVKDAEFSRNLKSQYGI